MQAVDVQELINHILEFMKNKNVSFVKMHEVMDKNKDNNINSRELREFFLKEMDLKLSVEELQALMSHFD